MTLQSLRKAWTQFFFAERSPIPIALFRIVYSLLIIATLIFLKPDWLNWYGVHGCVPLQTARTLESGTRLNLFSVIPQSDIWIEALFWISLISASLLALGFLSRVNSVVVFICLTSIHQRNLYINHGGDTFLRLAGFFLIFAPAGAALSIDRLIRIRRGRESGEILPCRPWAQRMIQLQLSLLYLATFLLKVKGTAWLGGTALYYVYHLDELRRFPLPSWFFHPVVLTLGSWGALLLEFSLGVLIWVKELRYILLALGVLFHLWLEYSLNIPMFQWDILSAYVLFVHPDDWNRAASWRIWHAPIELAQRIFPLVVRILRRPLALISASRSLRSQASPARGPFKPSVGLSGVSLILAGSPSRSVCSSWSQTSPEATLCDWECVQQIRRRTSDLLKLLCSEQL